MGCRGEWIFTHDYTYIIFIVERQLFGGVLTPKIPLWLRFYTRTSDVEIEYTGRNNSDKLFTLNNSVRNRCWRFRFGAVGVRFLFVVLLPNVWNRTDRLTDGDGHVLCLPNVGWKREKKNSKKQNENHENLKIKKKKQFAVKI